MVETGSSVHVIDLKTESVEELKHLPIKLITDSCGAMAVTGLEKLAFKGNGEDIFTLATLGKIGWLWGAYDDGVLVGAIEVFRQNDPKKGFIHGVIIHPDAQYKGLGTRLIKDAEGKAINDGIEQMECTIAPTNGASLRAFLNNSGYQASKYLSNCYGDCEHRLWVVKNLKSPTQVYDYKDMLEKQENGETVYFVEDDDYGSLESLLKDDRLKVIGISKPEETGASKNLLCVVRTNVES